MLDVSRPRVVFLPSVMPTLAEALAEEFGARAWDDIAADGELQQVEVVVAATADRVDSVRMDQLPRLRAIVNFGVGYDNVEVAAAQERGIIVSNTPDVLTDCVADLTVGLVIDVVRGISAADRFVRSGSWLQGRFPLTGKLGARKVGIFGLGRIGRAVAARLVPFGCALAYTGRAAQADSELRFEPDLVALAGWSDVLVVTAAGGAATRGIVSRAVLDALGPQGYLVNVARGSLVDEEELVDAIVHERIAGAALDVFADEPRVPDALRESERVVVVPHIGSGTRETRAAMADLVRENVRSFLGTGELVTPVPESAARSVH